MIEPTAVRRVAVYTGTNIGSLPAYRLAAEQLGAELARCAVGLVYGGGKAGLMGVVADAALAAGGEVIGVIPEFLEAKELAHQGLTELRVVDSMHTRKAAMAALADGFIALPGGFGTLEEIVEMLTWTQLGLQASPIVFFDVEGYWSGIFACSSDDDRRRFRPIRAPGPRPARHLRRARGRPRHWPGGDRARQVDRPRRPLTRGRGLGTVGGVTVPFPPQPEAIAWPTGQWAYAPPGVGVDRQRLDGLLDRAFGDPQPAEHGLSLAAFVVHRGQVIAERYGPRTGPETTLISWSMAKSMVHAVVGLLVGDGLISVDDRAPVDEWSGDSRGQITIQQLLDMSSGLAFVEDYVDDTVSDVIEMLFGAGAADHAGFAAAKPLIHPPDTVWNYASGTTNILARIAGRLIGDGPAATERYLRERLFDPLGMRSATPKFDDAGTFVGSSYVFATAAISPGSGISTCATASGTGGGCSPRAGRRTPTVRSHRRSPTPTATATARTGGAGIAPTRRSAPTASRPSGSSSARHATWSSSGSARPMPSSARTSTAGSIRSSGASTRRS